MGDTTDEASGAREQLARIAKHWPLRSTDIPKLSQAQAVELNDALTVAQGRIAELECANTTLLNRLSGALALVPPETLCGELQESAKRLPAAERQLAEAREWLQSKVLHPISCDRWTCAPDGDDYPCTCGLDAFLSQHQQGESNG